MNKTFMTLLIASTLSIALSACQSRRLDTPPGTYERSSSYTDSNGTTRERETSTDVSIDADGNRKSVTKSKTTTDPKGLFNKSTTSSTKQTIQEKQ